MDLRDVTITEYMHKPPCVYIRDNDNVLLKRKNGIGGWVQARGVSRELGVIVPQSSGLYTG